jgi:DNA repair photolyase
MPRPIDNPPNPWHGTHVDWIDAPPARLHVYHETAKSILSSNDSPDLPFRWSLNPYRGCFHACAYCYARPSHQYWDFGAGTDFERRIVVKTNAPDVLRATFAKRTWQGELIVFSGNTDCYQPLEASYELTRRCLQVCLEHRNPVALITKGALIRRDVDVLAELSQVAHVHVNLSIAFADAAMARAIEPSAPSPRVRLEAIEALAQAGVSVGIGVSPIIPGLNDDQVVEILERAAAAGATRAWRTLLRLPGPVEGIFVERLRDAFPARAEKVLSALRETRGGTLYRGGYGTRMSGQGARWTAITSLFDTTARRLGIDSHDLPERYWENEQLGTTFIRPGDQLGLALG